ncbi:hypothetical protein [Intrasporangium sp. DVR]|uniref:hypothetical protein n=1 Tax=Intrasporangium sp. DVR TaxID=3127867 RepID=UPI00313A6B13
MLGRTTRRLAAGAALAGGLVLGTGAGAWAHECINSSRSDRGSEMAGSRSQAWFTIHVDEAIQGDVADGFLTPEQGACILQAYAATGSPMSFTIHVKGANGNDGTLAANNPNDGLMANGRGVDSFFALYGEAIFGAFAGCGVEF